MKLLIGRISKEERRMKNSLHPRGWQIHHQEQLFFRAGTGAPTIQVKFFHYPAYRQTVQINKFPVSCTLKTKGDNTFFLFQQKVKTKGTISLERIITVFPSTSPAPPTNHWGLISDTPLSLQQKYKQSSWYWPVRSAVIQKVTSEEWFATDELSSWVYSMYRYLRTKIKHPEKQEKRHGADHAFLTGEGDCDEFTDLFITLARIRGIPCRRLTGYVITEEGKKIEAHAWGEIRSPALGWIPIDVSLNNLGNHTINYVIVKIEEFNPSLLKYQIQTRPPVTMQYQWEHIDPFVTPIY